MIHYFQVLARWEEYQSKLRNQKVLKYALFYVNFITVVFLSHADLQNFKELIKRKALKYSFNTKYLYEGKNYDQVNL